jgi:two-component sensor histidine kinase
MGSVDAGRRAGLGQRRVLRALHAGAPERGGPLLTGPPSRSGFGTQLIDCNAGSPLDGHIERHWEPEGLRCVLHIGPGALLANTEAG